MMRWLLPLGLLTATVAASAADWPSRVPSAKERGEDLYERYCLSCHGEGAAGDGPTAQDLVHAVPDLSGGLRGLERDRLVRVVRYGKGTMPGFEQAFRDLKPHDMNFKADYHAVLDHMEKVAREARNADRKAEAAEARKRRKAAEPETDAPAADDAAPDADE